MWVAAIHSAHEPYLLAGWQGQGGDFHVAHGGQQRDTRFVSADGKRFAEEITG